MITYEGARRVQQIGGLIAKVGGFVGIALCLAAFTGQLSYFWPKLFLLPVVVGSAITFVGVVIEKFAKQSDVGRQMRQP